MSSCRVPLTVQLTRTSVLARPQHHQPVDSSSTAVTTYLWGSQSLMKCVRIDMGTLLYCDLLLCRWAHGELFIIIGNYECDDTRITTQTVTGSPVSIGFDYSSVDVVF